MFNNYNVIVKLSLDQQGTILTKIAWQSNDKGNNHINSLRLKTVMKMMTDKKDFPQCSVENITVIKHDKKKRICKENNDNK